MHDSPQIIVIYIHTVMKAADDLALHTGFETDFFLAPTVVADSLPGLEYHIRPSFIPAVFKPRHREGSRPTGRSREAMILYVNEIRKRKVFRLPATTAGRSRREAAKDKLRELYGKSIEAA
jgi:hypothetical protein